jgi:hypothetical protein
MGLWRFPLTANVPYRSILPRGIDGLLMAAKSYSTDHDASIGGRMQRDLQHLGKSLAWRRRLPYARAWPRGGST